MTQEQESDLRFTFEERAAIMEYCGGLTREDAECAAAKLLGKSLEWFKGKR